MADNFDRIYNYPNNSAKFWKYSFVAVNLHPNNCLYFPGLINNIAPEVKIGETDCFGTERYHVMMLYHPFLLSFLFFWSGLRGSKAYSLWGGVIPSLSIGYDYL